MLDTADIVRDRDFSPIMPIRVGYVCGRWPQVLQYRIESLPVCSSALALAVALLLCDVRHILGALHERILHLGSCHDSQFSPFHSSSRQSGAPPDAVFFCNNQTVFLQGDSSDSIFYIESGAVKLTVTSSTGKEAFIGLLNGGEFFGESCLASANPVRFHTATAVTDLRLLKIDRRSMLHILRTNPDFASAFTSYLVQRNEQIQQALADSLLSSTEERLAQVLSHLKSLGAGHLALVFTQQDLANMVGASRQRVNVLMQRRRRSGSEWTTYDK